MKRLFDGIEAPQYILSFMFVKVLRSSSFEKSLIRGRCSTSHLQFWPTGEWTGVHNQAVDLSLGRLKSIERDRVDGGLAGVGEVQSNLNSASDKNTARHPNEIKRLRVERSWGFLPFRITSQVTSVQCAWCRGQNFHAKHPCAALM